MLLDNLYVFGHYDVEGDYNFTLMLTAQSLNEATFYLSRRLQGSMPTQFFIVFDASTKSIRVYLDSFGNGRNGNLRC